MANDHAADLSANGLIAGAKSLGTLLNGFGGTHWIGFFRSGRTKGGVILSYCIMACNDLHLVIGKSELTCQTVQYKLLGTYRHKLSDQS
jgi:hypothetical protein